MIIQDILDSARGQNPRFVQALELLLNLECVYSKDGKTIRSQNVANDSGGLTFAGIDFRSHPTFPFKNPTPEAVWKSYWVDYWNSVNAGSLNAPIGEIVFIQGANQGSKKVIQLLQRALNSLGTSLVPDGICGTRTIVSANKLDAHTVAAALLKQSQARYDRIVSTDPSKMKFKEGWDNRVAIIRSEYLT